MRRCNRCGRPWSSQDALCLACQPTTCTCDTPQPTPTASPDAGACGRCHRLILEAAS